MTEQAQWPDEAFEKAKAWADRMSDIKAPLGMDLRTRDLYDEVRAEERRREPKVCGAKAPAFPEGGSYIFCESYYCKGDPHKNGSLCWYDPSQCEREHVDTIPSTRYLVISYGQCDGIVVNPTDSWREALETSDMNGALIDDNGNFYDSFILDREQKRAWHDPELSVDQGCSREHCENPQVNHDHSCPPCERPHMTEAAQRVIRYAREIAEAHHENALRMHEDAYCPECAIFRALFLYDKEAQQ